MLSIYSYSMDNAKHYAIPFFPFMERIKKINVLKLAVLILGAGMTIVSAILAGYYGERHMRALQEVNARIAAQERLIAEHWQDAQALRDREDGVILFALLAQNARPLSPELAGMLARTMEHTLHAANAPASIVASVTAAIKGNKGEVSAPYEATLSAIETHHRLTLDAIDVLYGEVQGMHREERMLQMRDSRLRILALFCQIMGLILVLAAKSGI